MQFTTALIVTSFLAFLTGVHSATLSFYERDARGCTNADPGDLQIKSNSRCNICIQPPRPNGVLGYKTVHGFNVTQGQQLDVHSANGCSTESLIVTQQGQGWATAQNDNRLIRSVYVSCPGQQRDETKEPEVVSA